MNNNSNLILFISFGVSFLILLVYILLFKNPTSSNIYLSTRDNNNSFLNKSIKMFGADLLYFTPDSIKNKYMKETKIEEMLRKSNNPWKVTPLEFLAVQLTLGFLGILAAIAFLIFFTFIGQTGFLTKVFSVMLPVVGFLYPRLKYNSKSSTREEEFKTHLPAAIDLLNMSLSGGNFTLINGIREIIPHLENTPVKEEFIKVLRDIESGMTLEDALNNFEYRSPTEGIKAFVRALNHANKMSVEMNTILEARAKASRQELFDAAMKKIQQLPTRIMLSLGPALLTSVLIVAASPAVYSLIKSLS